jgi:hypothetical protein
MGTPPTATTVSTVSAAAAPGWGCVGPEIAAYAVGRPHGDNAAVDDDDDSEEYDDGGGGSCCMGNADADADADAARDAAAAIDSEKGFRPAAWHEALPPGLGEWSFKLEQVTAWLQKDAAAGMYLVKEQLQQGQVLLLPLLVLKELLREELEEQQVLEMKVFKQVRAYAQVHMDA